jgi:hypothetical protein
MRVLIVVLLLLAGCAQSSEDLAWCAAQGYGPDAASRAECRRGLYAERQHRLAWFRDVPVASHQ